MLKAQVVLHGNIKTREIDLQLTYVAMRVFIKSFMPAFIIVFGLIACDDDNNVTTDTDSDDETTLPDVYASFYNVENVYLDGDYVVIETKDLPDHGSPFYPEDDENYEEYDGDNTNFSTEITVGGQTVDPDLEEQDVTFRIPVNPAEASSKQATSGGAIGVAINGVVIYNQYNGANEILDDTEFDNLDHYNGHPSPSNGQYHYHVEPLWLTSTKGDDALIGFLLDGFPIYGPEEDGVRLDNDDLDDYHGHFSATAEYPDGIYHYHVTDDAPLINGDGYFGTPGTVSR